MQTAPLPAASKLVRRVRALRQSSVQQVTKLAPRRASRRRLVARASTVLRFKTRLPFAARTAV